jgi:hypothetical protein
MQGSISRMNIAFKTADSLSAHAWCIAAGIRDSLRTAQFYVRDVSRADQRQQPAFLSRCVGAWARLLDRAMTKGANISIAMFLPSWRQMPSPFSKGLIDEVAKAISQNKLLENPLFNAYFFRSTQSILSRWALPPYLILEHRIDAARRNLALAEPVTNKLQFLAHALIALVESAPIARYGAVQQIISPDSDANIAVCATSCLALLLAEDSGELKDISEDEFFAIVGALMEPRLNAMATAIKSKNVTALARELETIRDLY